MTAADVSRDEVEELLGRLDREAEASGYHLNPDREFTEELIAGLLANQTRYGYLACPCRLAEGDRAKDLDILCPCDYRDPDLGAWGTCYCALYVSESVLRGETEIQSIPERRPAEPSDRAQAESSGRDASPAGLWRCRVCGYLCARSAPPERCPICGATHDRFEPFTLPAA